MTSERLDNIKPFLLVLIFCVINCIPVNKIVELLNSFSKELIYGWRGFSEKLSLIIVNI